MYVQWDHSHYGRQWGQVIQNEEISVCTIDLAVCDAQHHPPRCSPSHPPCCPSSQFHRVSCALYHCYPPFGSPPPQLFGPGGKIGEIPMDEQQATGLKCFQLLGEMEGYDAFDLQPLNLRPPIVAL